LPDQIPKQLRDLAQFLPEFEDNEGGWFKGDAIAVLGSLEGTNIAISEAAIFNSAHGGYTQTVPGLSIHRFPNEADADYSVRSRSLALVFIQDYNADDDKTLFALAFPLWKDAA